MKKSIAFPIYCVGFLFVVAGFIADDFNNPQDSAFSPLGIALYTIGAIAFVVGFIYIIKSKVN